MQALFEEKSWVQKLKGLFWLILIAGVVVVAVALWRGQAREPVISDPEGFQAVFLTNGQVYFGKLRPLSREFWSLTEVYYLRAGTVQQAGIPESLPALDLIKLGAEVHAPRDEMMISKHQVIFYEDIGPDSEVMRLIRTHRGGL